MNIVLYFSTDFCHTVLEWGYDIGFFKDKIKQNKSELGSDKQLVSDYIILRTLCL